MLVFSRIRKYVEVRLAAEVQMQIIVCSIALMLMNGAYLAVSFNMDSLVSDESEPDVVEFVSQSNPSMDFELADLLDLDILDFDVEELANSTERSSSLSSRSNIARDESTMWDFARLWQRLSEIGIIDVDDNRSTNPIVTKWKSRVTEFLTNLEFNPDCWYLSYVRE